MGPIVPLSMARLDFLPVWADEALFPAHPTVCAVLECLDVGGRELTLVSTGKIPLAMLVYSPVSLAAFSVLEGNVASGALRWQKLGPRWLGLLLIVVSLLRMLRTSSTRGASFTAIDIGHRDVVRHSGGEVVKAGHLRQ